MSRINHCHCSTTYIHTTYMPLSGRWVGLLAEMITYLFNCTCVSPLCCVSHVERANIESIAQLKCMCVRNRCRHAFPKAM